MKKKTALFLALPAALFLFFTGQLGSGSFFDIKAAFGYGGDVSIGVPSGGLIVFGGSGWANTPSVTATGGDNATVPMTVYPTQTGTLTQAVSGGHQVILSVPTGAVNSQTIFTVTSGMVDSFSLPSPETGAFLVGNRVFYITAKDAGGNAVSLFNKYLTITLVINGLPANTGNLGAYYYNPSSGKWILIPGATFDPATWKVNFQVNHLTTFAVFDVAGVPSTMEAYQSQPAAVQPDGAIEPIISYPTISGQPYPDGVLLRGTNGRVYVIENGQKRWIRTMAELKNYLGQPIIDTTDQILAYYPETTSYSSVIGLPNPASTYCLEKGGKLNIRTDANGEYGVCVFPNGRECEEWAFFRGECHSDYDNAGQIPSAVKDEAKKYGNGNLLRGSDNKIYLIHNNEKQYIPSLDELGAFRGQKIYDVSDSVLNLYPNVNIWSEGSLVRKIQMEVYVIKNGIKYHIKNLSELANYAGKKIYNVVENIFDSK